MRQFRIDGWARERIEELRRVHPRWTAIDVLRELEEDKQRGAHLIPVERTIRDFLKALAAQDDQPWEIDPDGDGKLARAVLDTMRDATLRAGVAHLVITQREARWIAWLADAAPSLPPYLRLVAVWHINGQRAAGRSLVGLTAFLEWEPWASEYRLRAYEGAVKAKTGDVPVLLYVHAKRIATGGAEQPERRSNIAAAIEGADWYREETDGTQG